MTHPLFQRQFLYVMRLKYFLFRKLCFTLERLFAKETDDAIQLHCDIFDHSGKKIFKSKVKKPHSQSKLLGIEMGNDILAMLGQSVIDNLDNFENDFDYTPDR